MLTYDQMMQMAMASDFCETVDLNGPAFLAPESMTEAVRSYLGRPELPLKDVLSCVYHSLAQSYKTAILEIEKISGKKIKDIYIVGGGSKDGYLNTLTARYTGRRVLTGVKEGTAAGNILSQIMRDLGLSLDEARKIIKNTYEMKEYK